MLIDVDTDTARTPGTYNTNIQWNECVCVLWRCRQTSSYTNVMRIWMGICVAFCRQHFKSSGLFGIHMSNKLKHIDGFELYICTSHHILFAYEYTNYNDSYDCKYYHIINVTIFLIFLIEIWLQRKRNTFSIRIYV